jgi:hypothetical protein
MYEMKNGHILFENPKGRWAKIIKGDYNYARVSNGFRGSLKLRAVLNTDKNTEVI